MWQVEFLIQQQGVTTGAQFLNQLNNKRLTLKKSDFIRLKDFKFSNAYYRVSDNALCGKKGKLQVKEESQKSKSNLEYEVLQELSLGTSAGDLPKWLVKSGDTTYYAKGRRTETSLEPEVEVCAYKLACLFGVPAIKYILVKLPDLSKKSVCLSKDFSNGDTIMSLYRYLTTVLGKVLVVSAKARFDLIESILSFKDRQLHRQILLFDYIIGNTDRHLRNFDLRIQSGHISLVYMYDNGASLFSALSLSELRKAALLDDNYQYSRPYIHPHNIQLKFLQSQGVVASELFNKVQAEDISQVISEVFKGERAKYLNLYVVNNIKRLGLLK